jgi:hypothetical protein
MMVETKGCNSGPQLLFQENTRRYSAHLLLNLKKDDTSMDTDKNGYFQCIYSGRQQLLAFAYQYPSSQRIKL